MTAAADPESEKRAAATAAAELVGDGMSVGLGTGSTVAHLLPALAARGLSDLRCIATSPATETAASDLGLPVEPFTKLSRLDLAIDGADQVTPAGWLVKGGGGAHLREKIVAMAAQRFIVICDSTKAMPALRGPIPLELNAFGLRSTCERLESLGELRLRDTPPSPDGGLIADLHVMPDDPGDLARRLDAEPAVAGHGLFPPALVDEVLIATGEDLKRFSPA